MLRFLNTSEKTSSSVGADVRVGDADGATETGHVPGSGAHPAVPTHLYPCGQ